MIETRANAIIAAEYTDPKGLLITREKAIEMATRDYDKLK